MKGATKRKMKAEGIKEKLYPAYKNMICRLTGSRLARLPGASYAKKLVFGVDRAIRPENMLTVDLMCGRMMLDPTDEGVTPFLLGQGIYEKFETELFLSAVEPGMVIADVGANIGYHTLLAAMATEGEGRVFAFEPEPVNFALLVRNVELNEYPNVTAVQRAVSNEAGEALLFRDESNWGAHSLSDGNVSEEDTLRVETVTLDGYFEQAGVDRIDVLKLDVQGAEGLALEGARRVLQSPDILVFTEFWPSGLSNVGTDPVGLLEWLKDEGFRLYLIDDKQERLVESGIGEILSECDKQVHDVKYVNLLLQKA